MVLVKDALGHFKTTPVVVAHRDIETGEGWNS